MSRWNLVNTSSCPGAEFTKAQENLNVLHFRWFLKATTNRSLWQKCIGLFEALLGESFCSSTYGRRSGSIICEEKSL